MAAFRMIPVSFMVCAAMGQLHQTEAASPEAGPLVIETRVLDVGLDEIVDHHRIVFTADRIVDFDMRDDQRPVIYDLKAGVIREVLPESVVSIRELLSAMNAVKDSVTNPEDRETLGLDAVVPSKPADGVYQASFRGARYEVHTEETPGGRATVAIPYFVRLASALNWRQQRGLPPFARLALYDQISKDGRIVRQISLTIQKGDESRQLQGTTEVVSLSDADRTRLESLGSAS